jgi:transposase-like protein
VDEARQWNVWQRLRETDSQREIARKLGIPESTLRGRIDRWLQNPPTDDLDGIDEDAETDELRKALARIQRDLTKEKNKTDAIVQAVTTAAHDASLIVGKAEPVPKPPSDKRKGEEFALLHLTDWQLGKKTVSYSTDRCEERVMHAVQRAIRLTELQRQDHPVRTCHLMLGGDLIENVRIFKSQVWEVDSGLYEQLFRASNLVEAVVLRLLTEFENVHVHEVWGNHGRAGDKGELPTDDNLDRVVGRIARDRLALQVDAERLIWPEPEPMWYRIIPIGDYKAFLCHGDQIKQWGGNLPAYGIMRATMAWASGVVDLFTDVYMGHFHREMTLMAPGGQKIFVTPSTESGSRFAQEVMKSTSDTPAQRLHFIDPRRGRVTAPFILWLD